MNGSQKTNSLLFLVLDGKHEGEGKLRVRLFWCSVPNAVAGCCWCGSIVLKRQHPEDQMSSELTCVPLQASSVHCWQFSHAGRVSGRVVMQAVLTHQDYSDLLDVKNAHKEKSDVSHILVNCTSCPLVSCCRDSAQPQDRRQPRWAWMTVNPKPLILLYSSILTN